MIYYTIKYLFFPILWLFTKPKVKNKEKFSAVDDKKAIIIMNHISKWDPVMLAIAKPGKRIEYMAKHQLFKFWPFAILLKGLGAFPINRNIADISSVKKALSVVKNGGLLGIFPEGTRSETSKMLPFHQGTAMIALKSKALVLPVALHNKYGIFRRPRLTVGNPIELTDYHDNKLTSEVLEEVTSIMFDSIDSMLKNGW